MSIKKNEVVKSEVKLVTPGEYQVKFVEAKDFLRGPFPGTSFEWIFKIVDEDDTIITKLTPKTLSSASKMGVWLSDMTGKTTKELMDIDDVGGFINDLEGSRFTAVIENEVKEKGTYNKLLQVLPLKKK